MPEPFVLFPEESDIFYAKETGGEAMENQKKRHCLITAEIEIDEKTFKDDQAMADFLDQHGITGLIACTPYEASTYQEFATYEETLQAHKEHLQKVGEHFADMELSSRNLELAHIANGYDLSQLLKGTNWTEEEIQQWFPSITEKSNTNF